MATVPSPFFFPTTSPAYAPTTVFPPPSFCFGAPAYGHYPIPFTAPSPFPYTSNFPSAATYHHPFPSPIPTQIDPNRPPTAPPPIHGDPYLTSHLFPIHTQPSPLQYSFHTPACFHTAPANDLFLPASGSPGELPSPSMETWPAPPPFSTLPAPAPDSSKMQPDNEPLLKLPGREMDALQCHARDTADALARLPSTASSTTPATTLPSTASASVAPQMFGEMPQSYGFHNLNRQSVILADGTKRSYFSLPADYPLEMATPPVLPSATEKVGVSAVAAQAAGLAPVLYSKANTTAGSESLLVPNLQRQINMKDASNVFKEMHVYDIYEEDNSCLKCMDEQFAKPFHKASENAFSEKLLMCISKASETEKTIACLNYSSHLFGFTLEMQQQDDEKSSNCSVLPIDEKAPTNVLQLRVPQLSIVVIHERRREWDPGDIVGVLHTAILTEETSNHLTKCTSLKYLLQSVEIRRPRILNYFFIPRYCSVNCNSWLNSVLLFMCDQVEDLNPLSLTTPWDPGVLVRHSGITRNTRTTRDAFPQSLGLKCIPFHMISNYLTAIFNMQMMQYAIQCHGFLFAITSSLSNQAISYFTDQMLLVLSTSCREVVEDCLANQELVANISCKLAALTWHSSITGNPFLLLNSTNYTWDPCVLKFKDTTLDKCAVPHQVQFVQQTTELLLQPKFIWLLLFTEEKEVVTLIPEQWICRCNAMHYCKIFQRRTTMSSLFHCHGIPLWLINFQVP